MNNLSVVYQPFISEDEKKIIQEAFPDTNISFSQYITKSMVGGSFDISIIINLLNNEYITALLNTGQLVVYLSKFIKAVFDRNNKKIEDNNSRPRYTTVTLRFDKFWVSISNINPDSIITISKLSADFEEIKRAAKKGALDKYSDEKLNEYIKAI
jgi:hypothetical protein